MFNDFKLLNYSTSTNKIRKIKDLLDRLDLTNQELEIRIASLQNSVRLTDRAIQQFKSFYEEVQRRRQIPPTPTPSNLPDLTITSIIPTLYTNYINLQITIKNIGLTASTATTLDSIIPSLLNYNVPVPALIPNTEFITNIQYSFDPSGTSEQKTFSSTVNPTHIIQESNFINNSLSAQIQIKSFYSPDANTYFIVHLHNPEGKEINSITGVTGLGNPFAPATFRITDGFLPLTDGAKNLSEHGIRHQTIIPGPYFNEFLIAQFNGIEIQIPVDIIPGTTTEVIFTFERIESFLEFNYNYITQDSGSTNIPIIRDIYNPHIPWYTRTKIEIGHGFGGNVSGSWSALSSYKLNIQHFEQDFFAQCFVNGIKPSFDILCTAGFDIPIIDYNIDINIIPQISFNKWCIQNNIIGEFQILLVLDSLNNQYSLSTNTTGSQVFSLLANKNYNKLSAFNNFFTEADRGIHINSGSNSPYIISLSDTKQAHLEGNSNLKISSVPYDLLGTAV